MKVGRICNRRVSTISKNEPVLEAARRMRDEHVGDLVVLDDDGGRRVPVGIVTDRDIVVGLLAKDVDHLRQLDVKDVLTHAVTAVHQDDDVEDVILEMQRMGVRRMPVVDDAGELSGIFTVDDFLGLLCEDLASIVSLVANARRREMTERT
jgi:CBS domain-containing protein